VLSVVSYWGGSKKAAPFLLAGINRCISGLAVRSLMSKKSSAVAVEAPTPVDRKESPYIPLNDFVLIRRIDESEESVGSILIPEQAKKKSNKAEVLAVGSGRVIGEQLIPIDLIPGDVVLFARHGGTESELDGEKVLVIRAAEIYLKLRRYANTKRN
jgi:chaperonin GroES